MTALLFFLEIEYLEHSFIPLLSSFFIIIPVFLIMNQYKDKFYSRIFIIAVFMHFIVLVFWEILKYHILNFPIPNENHFYSYTSDNDGALYHSLGIEISSQYNIDVLTENYTGGLFPKITGSFYHIFGVNPFIICVFNSFISSFSAPVLYFIGLKTFISRSYAKIYSLLSICTFSHLINSSVLIRDGYITLFMYLSLMFAYLFYKKPNIFNLLFTIGSLYLLFSFRPYAAAVMAASSVSAWLIMKIKVSLKKGSLSVNKFGLCMLLLFPFIAAGLAVLSIKAAGIYGASNVEDLIDIRNKDYQFGGAEIKYDFNALYSKFILLPYIIGYIYLFLAPFPWTWVKTQRIIYIPDMLMLYAFIPSFIRGLVRMIKYKNYFLAASFFSILFMFSIYCITLGNAGAIHRLRGPFIPMIYLIAMSAPDRFLSRILSRLEKWKII